MPSFNVADFQRELEKSQQSYKEAASSWKPPASPEPYLCIIVEFKKGVQLVDPKNPKSGNMFTVTPIYQILEDLNLNGKQFAGQRYTNRNQDALGILKDFIGTVLGEPCDDLVAGITALDDIGVGSKVRVQMFERGGKDSKGVDRTYLNDRLVEVVERGGTPSA